jgi:hypothetical protein
MQVFFKQPPKYTPTAEKELKGTQLIPLCNNFPKINFDQKNLLELNAAARNLHNCNNTINAKYIRTNHGNNSIEKRRFSFLVEYFPLN